MKDKLDNLALSRKSYVANHRMKNQALCSNLPERQLVTSQRSQILSLPSFNLYRPMKLTYHIRIQIF